MALVIKRTPQEQFFITHPEGRVTITLLGVSGHTVSLGIDAPRSVIIERDDMKKKTETDYEPCRRCGQPGYGDLGGLCFRCEQGERGD